MGLIEFAKNVGRKLRIGDQDEKPQQGQTRPAVNQGAGNQQQVAQAQERGRETALAGVVKQMGFNTESLVVDIEGDKVTLRGNVVSQEEREKIVLLVGNHEGIGSVDDQLNVKNPAPEAQYYEVKSGDTLSKISKQFYGDANKYHQIFEANKPMLKDPDEIYPGQKLRIPAGATASTGTAQA
ncbi:MAG TPA: peptidoglycan-binding protein LysM [Thermoanaerobaculia bacterium]|nr:peptidoglycan-binding protein LysM [Thermoanaerobaculia bacterium]